MEVFEERLLLFAGQELVVARDRVEQDLRVAIVPGALLQGSRPLRVPHQPLTCFQVARPRSYFFAFADLFLLVLPRLTGERQKGGLR